MRYYENSIDIQFSILTGVVRSMHCNPDFPADVIPVDTAINAIIAAAWERGMNETKKIQYCNVTLPHEKQMTWGESVEKGKWSRR